MLAHRLEGKVHLILDVVIDVACDTDATGFGQGAELRRPLGISIVGGFAVNQLLTLYATPVIYLYLDRFRVWGYGSGALATAASTLIPLNPASRIPRERPAS